MECNLTKNLSSVTKFTNANHKSEQFEYAVTFNAFSSIAYHFAISHLVLPAFLLIMAVSQTAVLA